MKVRIDDRSLSLVVQLFRIFCCILASQIGAMDRQLEQAIAYARERKQFGQAIGKFQSVSNRIADMKMRIETARLLLYKTA